MTVYSESLFYFTSQVEVRISREMAQRQGGKGKTQLEIFDLPEELTLGSKGHQRHSTSSHSVSVGKITTWTISQCEWRWKAIPLPV